MVSADFALIEFPFVETSLTRHLTVRLKTALDARSFIIFAGGWGVGKTMTLKRFASNNPGKSLLLTVERGSMKTGARPIYLMEQVIRQLREVLTESRLKTYPHGYHSCQEALSALFRQYFDAFFEQIPFDNNGPKVLLIFDEAQFLSRDSIEMLRGWCDGASASVPYPIAVALVGNNEFDVTPKKFEKSAISGATHSRAMFVEVFNDIDLLDDDLVKIMQSRGLRDIACHKVFLKYFGHAGARRDLRRLDNYLRRLAYFGDLSGATPEVIRSILET
jgi:DNA transposition AAA+ family ATPase